MRSKGGAKRKSVQTRARTAPAATTPELTTPVVGIGASAGGLEAFTELLQALPGNTGLAFVLIQHLAPEHESPLTDLLAKATDMPVAEVTDGMRVEPNHVYVIPADTDLSLMDGLLHTRRRKTTAGRHLPIDYFLRSLAESRGPGAIGVILSGLASDGAAGIVAVKKAGGVTFAQDAQTARFGSMPQSAIDTGLVDVVLSPKGIARELARIAVRSVGGVRIDFGTPAGEAREWQSIFNILQAAAGVDFRHYMQGTIRRRVSRRMVANKTPTLKAYAQILEGDPSEAAILSEDLLILVTDFFRDPEVFAALQKQIFPLILKNKSAGDTIRIWSAGCSTGQEAYSIAMALLEYLGEKASGRTIQIFATDVSEAAIGKSRKGIYSESDVKGVSKKRLQRFFKRVDISYQINSAIREMCIFARHDLTRYPPFSNLDLVSCRNVLIYFEPALQKRVLASLHYGLRPGGVLLLGKSEGISPASELFIDVNRKLKFFTKAGGYAVFNDIRQPVVRQTLLRIEPPVEIRPAADLQKNADELMWERSGCAGLVVNDALRILHFRGDTSPYLGPSRSKASLQAANILRPEIALEVRSAFKEACETGKIARSAEFELDHDRHTLRVRIEVSPLTTEGPDKTFLVLFEPAPQVKPIYKGKLAKKEKSERKEIIRLKTEVHRTRKELARMAQSQETAADELQSAREEALSNIQELQSTNAELETVRAELQSSDEQMQTLNDQVQHRNDDLREQSTDLSNILGGVNIPIVVLGPDSSIRRFTPPAAELLGLIPGDVGRRIGKLHLNVDVPDLDDLIAAAIEQGKEEVRDVQAHSGRWHRLRVAPFRPERNAIEGVLLTLVDIDELRRHQETLQRDTDFISAILDAAKGLLVVVLDSKGRFTHFNRACQEATGYTLEEVQGHYGWEFLIPPEDAENVKATFAKAASGKTTQLENHWVTKDGRRILISWSNSVPLGDGDSASIVVTGIDVTAREEARRRAQQSEITIRALLESAVQAILACDRDGRIVLANPIAEKMFGYPAGALLGQSLESLLPESLRKRHQRHRGGWFGEPRNRPMGTGIELAGLRRDGVEFPIEVSLSSISTAERTLGVAFVSDITERKKNERTLLEYKDQLQKLTGALLLARESGNREVARELHDVFSQELAAVGMEISSLRETLKTDSGAAARLAELGGRIGRLSVDLHRTARELHPAILEELGLEPALQQECDSFQKKTGIATEFGASKLPRSIPPEVALCLYRVAQESLRNVQKHSDSPHVSVLLEGKPGGIALRVEDSGDGFDLEQAMRKGGLGLISMEERVRLVNGKLNVESASGKGTAVSAFVPLEPGKKKKVAK